MRKKEKDGLATLRSSNDLVAKQAALRHPHFRVHHPPRATYHLRDPLP
jgi:hypothetical protein